MIISRSQLIKEIISEPNLLIIQDIDGVCIPLVLDPLTRKIDIKYVRDVSKLGHNFAVLTNGEHVGQRGVNLLIDNSHKEEFIQNNKNMYLPGLAAGGIQLQDKYGNVTTPGVIEEELNYLNQLPKKIESRMVNKLPKLFPNKSANEILLYAKNSILDNQLSPTINLNYLFRLRPNDFLYKKHLQMMAESIMIELLEEACSHSLDNSFFLHKAPNLGKEGDNEIIKYSTENDIGTTDIQFMVKGAVKEAGLLVLINNYIKEIHHRAPLGEQFNARQAPQSHRGLVDLCIEKIDSNLMPTIIGIGDTVTSSSSSNRILRGGSDRPFLHLIQDLGKRFNKNNRIIFVDSSDGEVERPSCQDGIFNGISDPEDPLKFNQIMINGTKEYRSFFCQIANNRNINSPEYKDV